MSIFDNKRLTNETFKLDFDRMRRGWYSYKYFVNIGRMLSALAVEGYAYSGKHPNLPAEISAENIAVGDIEVEMQLFTRRAGSTIVVGVDQTLAMLRHCTDYWGGDHFVDTSDRLEVWAVHDGEVVKSDGNPLNVEPVTAGPTIRSATSTTGGACRPLPFERASSISATESGAE